MATRWTTIGFLLGFVAAIGCGGGTDGGSETGFASCTDDKDCTAPDERCIREVCTAPAHAGSGGSGGTPAAGSSGDAGSSSTGGSGATAEAGGASPMGGATAAGAGAGAVERGGASSAGAAGKPAGGAPTKPDCTPLTPEPIADPTPEEQERAKLVHDLCIGIVRDCPDRTFLGSVGQPFATCDDDVWTVACEQEFLYQYHLIVRPACDAAWLDAVRCLTATSLAPICGDPGPFGTTDEPCASEKAVLEECRRANFVQAVTGSRTTCTYGPSPIAPCDVSCTLGDNWFGLSCYGPEGLPMQCTCTVNGGLPLLDNGESIYASDCADAAARAADGACVNRLDCCFSYPNGASEDCRCESDPARWAGVSTCEELAASVDGAVVDICPQYDWPDDTNSCFPPTSCSP